MGGSNNFFAFKKSITLETIAMKEFDNYIVTHTDKFGSKVVLLIR